MPGPDVELIQDTGRRRDGISGADHRLVQRALKDARFGWTDRQKRWLKRKTIRDIKRSVTVKDSQTCIRTAVLMDGMDFKRDSREDEQKMEAARVAASVMKDALRSPEARELLAKLDLELCAPPPEDEAGGQ